MAIPNSSSGTRHSTLIVLQGLHYPQGLVNVHQVHLVCQATGPDNVHSAPLISSVQAFLHWKVLAPDLSDEILFSAPTEMDLRAEESGVWSGHLQRTPEWNGGGLTRGDGACPISGVTNAERGQVALLAGTVALLPLASARICLFLLQR